MDADPNKWTPTHIFICLKDEFNFPSWWIGSNDAYFIDIKSRRRETSIFDGGMAIVGDMADCTLKLYEIGITEPIRCQNEKEEVAVTSKEEFTMLVSVVAEVKKGKTLKLPKKILLEYKTLPPIYV
jgi:hypothetical protein